MSSSDPTAPVSGWLHFAGVAGCGMSGLAQLHALQGRPTTGSDRAFDQGERAELRQQLTRMGINIVPQDGSFLDAFAGATPSAVVVSTAVEDRVPDVIAARQKGVAILHRSELLARHVAHYRTIAISGTSGKSTVTAMVFAILEGAGQQPGLLTGGPLASLIAAGHPGNAWPPRPPANWLVIEADESDGSLVRYHPWCGVILNLGLDHKSPAEIMAMFATFSTQVSGPLLVADQPNLADLHPGHLLFGMGEGRGTRAREVQLQPGGSTFSIEGVPFQLQVPGIYNIWNAVAAVAAARAAGVPLAESAPPLAAFTGVARRFQSVGTTAGIEVIDDFAHNPDKIAAALAAARTRTNGRILAVFQPHGFAPTRFLKQALIDTFVTELREQDRLWLPKIFFAGGSVVRDISARDLSNEISARGRQAQFVPERDDLPQIIAAAAQTGDLILVMGARDPSLTAFCRDIGTAILALNPHCQ